MSKKINRPKNQKANKISSGATELKQSTDDETPVFSFKCTCSNHCQLSEWQNKELSLLVNCFKIMESLIWKDVRKHKGLNLKPIDHGTFPLPPNVPPDVTVEEIKVDDRRRIIGYRGGRIFHLIWFDRDHEVCPMGKPKRVNL